MNSGRSSLVLCAAAAMLSGCGGSQPAIGAAPLQEASARRPVEYVYVSNEIPAGSGWASSVNIYPAVASGDAAPAIVIGGSQTQLTHINGIAVNSAGEIFVADSDTNEVVGFAPGSSGNAAPNVTIAGSNTRIEWPVGLALDPNGNLYVGVCGSTCGVGSAGPSVLEFSAGSYGNAAPIRDISGSQTQLVDANDPAIDTKGNIYVTNWRSGTIDVFKANADGDAAPVHVIAGSNAMLDAPDGIAVNSWLYAGSSADHDLLRFRRNANGNASPVAVISGPKTHLDDVDGIALDHAGNIYASSPGNARILEFTPLSNGDVRPFRKIAGERTQLVLPVWVFVQ